MLLKIQSFWDITAYLQVNSYYLPRRHVPEDVNPAGITVGTAVSSFFYDTHIRSCKKLPARKSLFVSTAKRLLFVDECSTLVTPGSTRITVVTPEIATFRCKIAYLRYTWKSTYRCYLHCQRSKLKLGYLLLVTLRNILDSLYKVRICVFISIIILT